MDFLQERAFLMASLYSTGMTLEDIGVEFGVSRARVQQILAKIGVGGRDKCKHPADPIKVCREAATATNLKECARRAGCSVHQARRCLTELGKASVLDAWRAKARARKAEARRELLVRQLRELGDELGATPTLHDIMRAPGLNHQSYYKCFGSLVEAQRLAGFSPNTRGRFGTWRRGQKLTPCGNDSHSP